MDLVWFALGLALLFAGGEALVRGASTLARLIGLSPLVIGLTVVGFGTSAPELLVSIDAALAGSPDIALGNVVGSNIANVLLIGGAAALLAPFAGRGAFPARDLITMIGASGLLLGLATTGLLTRPMGTFLLACLVGYLVATALMPGRPATDEEEEAPASGSLPVQILVSLGFIAAGLLGLVYGAGWLVDSAVSIARDFGVSEATIGLTIVAVGTSLPELATTLIAARRGQSQIGIGNIIGSNIFNILGILGVTATVAPIPVAAGFVQTDIPLMIAISLVLSVMLLAVRRIGRAHGIAALALYAGYTAWLIL